MSRIGNCRRARLQPLERGFHGFEVRLVLRAFEDFGESEGSVLGFKCFCLTIAGGERRLGHGEATEVSISGSRLPRDGAWGRRETDLHFKGRSRGIPAGIGANMHQPWLAGARMGIDGQSFSPDAGNPGTEFIFGDEGVVGKLQPGLECSAQTPGARVSRPV